MCLSLRLTMSLIHRATFSFCSPLFPDGLDGIEYNIRTADLCCQILSPSIVNCGFGLDQNSILPHILSSQHIFSALCSSIWLHKHNVAGLLPQKCFVFSSCVFQVDSHGTLKIRTCLVFLCPLFVPSAQSNVTQLTTARYCLLLLPWTLLSLLT